MREDSSTSSLLFIVALAHNLEIEKQPGEGRSNHEIDDGDDERWEQEQALGISAAMASF
jgi:hypothetical protein